ncbi:MAG TPA: MFS transporter [Gammaproteobacteria bacterium]|nr:MFS transporter [Gammaproteobacteria bacterium]
MSAPIVDTGVATEDGRAKRNVAVLVFAHAILGSQLAINIIVAGLAGAFLANDPSLATLPISIVVVGSLLTAPAMSLFMGRYGRRAGFWVAALAGAIAAALCARALYINSFGLFMAGSVLLGVYQATQGFFRFAAADTASERFKPRAISWVLAGGLLSALLGPEIVRATSGTIASVPYAGAYLAMIALNVLGAAGLWFLDIPTPARAAKAADTGRRLAVIASQPVFLVAVLAAMVGFSSMSLVMTSTPLAMVGHGFTPDHAADVVRWHIVAMFAPSFATGAVIARFGRLPVIAVGLLLLGVCGAIALAGVDLTHFYLALIALGVGWNFSYIGATSLLGTTHTPAEQAKVQGLNDFLVLGFVAVGSFGSGALLDAFGWDAVQYAMAPALLVALVGVLWLASVQRRKAAGL